VEASRSGRPGGRPLREGGDGSRVGGVSVEASRSGRPGGRPLRGGVPGGRCAWARSRRAPGAWRPFPAGCRDGPAPFLEAAELCLGRGGPVQVTWPTCEPLSGRPGGRPLREGGDGSRVGGVSVEASRSGRPGGRPLRGGVPGGRCAWARSRRAPGAWRPFPAGCRDGPAPFLEAAELCLGRGGPVQVTWPTCEPLSGRPGGRPLREGADSGRVADVNPTLVGWWRVARAGRRSRSGHVADVRTAVRPTGRSAASRGRGRVACRWGQRGGEPFRPTGRSAASRRGSGWSPRGGPFVARAGRVAAVPGRLSRWPRTIPRSGRALPRPGRSRSGHVADVRTAVRPTGRSAASRGRGRVACRWGQRGGEPFRPTGRSAASRRGSGWSLRVGPFAARAGRVAAVPGRLSRWPRTIPRSGRALPRPGRSRSGHVADVRTAVRPTGRSAASRGRGRVACRWGQRGGEPFRPTGRSAASRRGSGWSPRGGPFVARAGRVAAVPGRLSRWPRTVPRSGRALPRPGRSRSGHVADVRTAVRPTGRSAASRSVSLLRSLADDPW
jgi:hypothetical protein